MSPEERSRNEKLIHGYNRMMERVKHSIDTFEDAVSPKLRQAIEAAQEKAVELGELTREEAAKVGEYLRRDIQGAAEHLAESEDHEFRDWLRFDIELIEDRLLEMFLSVADQAKLDMLQFEEELEEASEYRTGEITGPGTLQCMECGEMLHFHDTGHIPPCPKCHKTLFSRT